MMMMMNANTKIILAASQLAEWRTVPGRPQNNMAEKVNIVLDDLIKVYY